MKADLVRQWPSTNPELVTRVVAAYVTRNYLAPDQLPELIFAVNNQFLSLQRRSIDPDGQNRGVALPSNTRIRSSISDEALISFIDGHPYKTLKRHLTAHGLTPQQYRDRYGLPADYPMIAAAYAAQRSALARSIGLRVPGAQTKRGKAA